MFYSDVEEYHGLSILPRVFVHLFGVTTPCSFSMFSVEFLESHVLDLFKLVILFHHYLRVGFILYL